MDTSNILTLSGDALLRVNKYYNLYPNNSEDALALKRKLTTIWHPDKNPSDPTRAKEVLEHLWSLYKEAQEAIRNGVWGGKELHIFKLGPDREIQFKYKKKDLVPGIFTQYTGDTRICYEIPYSNKDLLEVWVENLEKIRKSLTPDMRKDKHLITGVDFDYGTKTLEDGGTLIYITKDPEQYSLKHILDKFGKLPPRHVVWIITRLMNIACLLQISDTPNLSISPDSILINPRYHSVALIEGWQYCTSYHKTKPLAIPSRTARLCPNIPRNESCVIANSLTLIKALARECLGDTIGCNLLKDKEIPKALSSWVNSGIVYTAVKELEIWEEVKRKAYGPPSWINWDLDLKDIYS